MFLPILHSINRSLIGYYHSKHSIPLSKTRRNALNYQHQTITLSFPTPVLMHLPPTQCSGRAVAFKALQKMAKTISWRREMVQRKL